MVSQLSKYIIQLQTISAHRPPYCIPLTVSSQKRALWLSDCKTRSDRHEQLSNTKYYNSFKIIAAPPPRIGSLSGARPNQLPIVLVRVNLFPGCGWRCQCVELSVCRLPYSFMLIWIWFRDEDCDDALFYACGGLAWQPAVQVYCLHYHG
jgi:hypothetical protein